MDPKIINIGHFEGCHRIYKYLAVNGRFRTTLLVKGVIKLVKMEGTTMNPKNDQKARKQVLTIIITMVYAISIGSGLMLPWIINASADEYPEYPDDGYLYESLEGNVLITNRTMMTLNQTIAQSGSNVCLENVTWYFAEDFLIEEGAAVTAINSSFLPANDGWGGYNNLGSLSMENCTIMNTTTAVTSTDGTLSMNDCEIGNTQYGINVSGSDDPQSGDVSKGLT